MTPLIELTRQKNFASWEGGSFNPVANSGRAVCIAGPDGEKRPVLFDQAVSRNRNHFLFVLDIGMYFAEAQVTLDSAVGVKIRVSLSKITSLYTENIQGHAVCRAGTDSVWACQSNHPSMEEALLLPEYSEDLMGFKPELKAFLQATVSKASTPRDKQGLFWGVPRKAVENV